MKYSKTVNSILKNLTFMSEDHGRMIPYVMLQACMRSKREYLSISISSNNGRKCSWFRIPSPCLFDIEKSAYENFRKSFPTSSMRTLLASLGGSVSTGVKYCVKNDVRY